jgi:DNA end-binding protein Ku
MPRAIWKGNIAFGLVNIPISLYSGESRPDIQLHMVDSRNHARVRYERVNAETGEEVPWDAMVKGYEYEEGRYVLLSQEELEGVIPKLTKTIQIDDFVNLSDIDPILFDKPYILEPGKRGHKAYALLRETLRQTGRAGIAKVVIRTREYLTALFVREEVLMLILLRFPQELNSADALDIPDSIDFKPNKRELDLAIQLVEHMSVDWDPTNYRDDYRANLMEYIESKVQSGDGGVKVRSRDGEDEEDGGNVVDLLDYLQRSVQGTGAGKSAKAPKSGTTSKTTKSPKAKKSTATKKRPAKKSGRRSA